MRWFLNIFKNPTMKVKCLCIPGCWYNPSLHFPRNKLCVTNPYHHRKCSKLFQKQWHHAPPKWHRFDSTGLPTISYGWNQFSLCCSLAQSMSPFPSGITLSTHPDHILHLPLIRHHHHHHLLKVQRFYQSPTLSQVFSGCLLLCRPWGYETLITVWENFRSCIAMVFWEMTMPRVCGLGRIHVPLEQAFYLLQ